MKLVFIITLLILSLFNKINSVPLEFTCGKTYSIMDIPTKIVNFNLSIIKRNIINIMEFIIYYFLAMIGICMY